MNSDIIVISSPTAVPGEITKVVELLKSGLRQFHIRKPDFDDFDMMTYITSIPKEYRKHLVLHSHYHLAKEFNLKGIQVGIKRVNEANEYKNAFEYFGYSAHAFNEIEENKERYTHFFLSPVFDSISKENYKANFKANDLSNFLQNNSDINIIALGGIDATNFKNCINLGFKGIALLGAIWNQNNSLADFSEIQNSLKSRPFVLSIAGFDPSSGAGITADIKTFEQHKVQGLGVTTAITYQNESKFLAVDWLNFDQINNQISILLSKYKPKFIKVGLIEDFRVLNQVVNCLYEFNKELKIIWDPILKASANFDFEHTISQNEVYNLLQKIYLVTPNIPECQALFGTDNAKAIQQIVEDFNLSKVLIKGGHSNTNQVSDVLVEQNNTTTFPGQRLENNDKHGTGCVLSAAICSNLANGMELPIAIKKAKQYITAFIESNKGLLGYHNTINK